MNGEFIGAIPVMSDGNRNFFDTTTLQVPVYKGLNVIRFTPQTNEIQNFLRSITFTYVGPFTTSDITVTPSGGSQ
jgi:hypothetical protein